MAYNSTLVPSQHQMLVTSYVDNGAPASSGLFGFIARNQHWAASVGLDYTNFMSSPAGFDSTDTITIRLLVPPFCEKVGFSLMATGDNGATAIAASPMKNRRITIAWTGTDAVKSAIVATGDYSDTLSNHTLADAREYLLTGIYEDAPQNTPRALTVQTTQSAAWVERDVDITIGAGMKVWQGAYFFIPASKYVVP